jgi:hypothetical protein
MAMLTETTSLLNDLSRVFETADDDVALVKQTRKQHQQVRWVFFQIICRDLC